MGQLTAIVLGSAAGGGFPQWNCRCAVCRLAWDGDPRVTPRTQASLAVSATASAGRCSTPRPTCAHSLPRHPRCIRAHCAAARSRRWCSTGGEIDQTAGLLNLRERQPFTLFGTQDTLAALAGNPMFGALAHDVVTRRAVAPGAAFALPGGLSAELFTVPGKVPLYLETGDVQTSVESGVNVGLEIKSGGTTLTFVPGAAAVTPALRERLARADVILFDGTLFRDDEMIASGTGEKTGRRMGHMPIEGADGSLAALKGLGKRRIYIHINNTNPILIEGSPERRQVEDAGFEVAADGLEIRL